MAHFEIPNERRGVAVVASTRGFHHTPARAVRSTGRLVIELVPIPPVVIELPSLVNEAGSYWFINEVSWAPGLFSAGDGSPFGGGQLEPSGLMELESAPYRGSLTVGLFWRGDEPESNLIPLVRLSIDVTPGRRDFAFPNIVCHSVELVPPMQPGAFNVEFDFEPQPGVDSLPSNTRSVR
ncbi:MAG: hypothetical protein AAFZ65_05255, partial [Planctomycetota bacterium]